MVALIVVSHVIINAFGIHHIRYAIYIAMVLNSVLIAALGIAVLSGAKIHSKCSPAHRFLLSTVICVSRHLLGVITLQNPEYFPKNANTDCGEHHQILRSSCLRSSSTIPPHTRMRLDGVCELHPLT